MKPGSEGEGSGLHDWAALPGYAPARGPMEQAGMCARKWRRLLTNSDLTLATSSGNCTKYGSSRERERCKKWRVLSWPSESLSGHAVQPEWSPATIVARKFRNHTTAGSVRQFVTTAKKRSNLLECVWRSNMWSELQGRPLGDPRRASGDQWSG